MYLVHTFYPKYVPENIHLPPSMYLHVLCTDRFIFGVKVCTRYKLDYVGLYWYHTIAWYIQVHTCTYQFELGTYYWSGFQMVSIWNLATPYIKCFDNEVLDIKGFFDIKTVISILK